MTIDHRTDPDCNLSGDKLEELNAWFHEADRAASEANFNGMLRRAIRDARRERGLGLPQLLRESGVAWDELEPFLAGRGPLSNDAIVRLVDVLKLSLSPIERAN